MVKPRYTTRMVLVGESSEGAPFDEKRASDALNDRQAEGWEIVSMFSVMVPVRVLMGVGFKSQIFAVMRKDVSQQPN